MFATIAVIAIAVIVAKKVRPDHPAWDRMGWYGRQARRAWRDPQNGRDGLPWAGPAAPPAAPDPALTREVEELKKRIAVLERIATSERHARGLADEIEALRDPAPRPAFEIAAPRRDEAGHA